MHNWKIEITLKSGKELTVYYQGNESSSSDVASKMLTGDVNSLSGFSNEDGTKNVFVKLGEIAVASISVR